MLSNFILFLTILSASFLQVTYSANTMPVTWNYHPTLMQCGIYIITTLDNTTVPAGPGRNYTINFNRLVNPSISYKPAVSFVGAGYIFQYNGNHYFLVNSQVPSPTSFIIICWADDASGRMTRYSINYLAISQNFDYFFIWIDYQPISPARQVNSTVPYTIVNTLGTTLPTLTNISTVLSFNLFEFLILQSSPYLFQSKLTVSILNLTHYRYRVSPIYARSLINWVGSYTIFYQNVITPYRSSLQVFFSTSTSTSDTTPIQIVNPSDLIDSFQINYDNTYFGVYALAFQLKMDFNIYYTSSTQMRYAFTKNKYMEGSIFIFRQGPTCPNNYFLSTTQQLCICNNIVCYTGVGCLAVTANNTTPVCTSCNTAGNFESNPSGSCSCKSFYHLSGTNCIETCGDGVKINHPCDDNNTIDGDGCSSTCQIEIGYLCTQYTNGVSNCRICPTNYIPSTILPSCVCNNTVCFDDCLTLQISNGTDPTCAQCSIGGNLNANGTCSCKSFYQLIGRNCIEICGDGVKINHPCDDNNTINGDGCSSNCQIESGYLCTQYTNGVSNCRICSTNYIPSTILPSCVCNDISCFPGCLGFWHFSGTDAICFSCNILGHFYLISNWTCSCINNFLPSGNLCNQVCGDGLKLFDQCDDGNTNNGDGCSSTCQIENDFVCSQNSNHLSVCLYKQNICFQVVSMIKNVDNSAIFTFRAVGNYFPFAFGAYTFSVPEHINMRIYKDNVSDYSIGYSLSKVYGQIVQLQVNFNETIQGKNAQITFDFNQSNYISRDCTLKFDCIGSELPLTVSEFGKVYGNASYANLVFVLLVTLIFFVSLFAPKWIGVEAVLAIQLIFFSQVLIVDTSNWPNSFQAFKYFKYASGFNEVIPSKISKNSDMSKKLSFLNFNEMFISNFLISSFILVIIFSVLWIVSKLTQKREDEYFKFRDKDPHYFVDLKKMSKISHKAYDVAFCFVMYSLLQFLASITLQISNTKETLPNQISVGLQALNTLLIPLSFMLIIFVALNNVFNIWLSSATMIALRKKVQLKKYRWISFVYHFILGIMIFCCNNWTIKNIPLSVFVMMSQLIYIIFILKFQPYRNCLKIHKIGLIFTRLSFFGFLGFINLKNFVPDIDENIMVAMCYFIISIVFIIIIMSCIRLYYDLRYGEQLQIKIQQENEEKERQYQRKQKQQAKQKLKEFKESIQSKMNKRQKELLKNKYHYPIQMEEIQQEDHLEWLYKRDLLSTQEKQKRYYEKFTEKPLGWLKKHDQKQYQKRIKKQEEQKKVYQQKNNKLDESQLKILKKKMREDLLKKKLVKKQKKSK